MRTFELKVQKREGVGRNFSKKSRKTNNIPCVLYGKGSENVFFTTFENDVKKLVYTPIVHTVKLDVDGEKYDAVLKDIQYHPVTDKIQHIDFLRIYDDKKVDIEVPVKLHGFAIGVKEGGKLTQLRRKIKVRGLMKDLPDVINLNIDDLKIGHSVKVQDVKVDNIEFMEMKNAVIASVKITRNVVEEAAPGTEGAAAAPAAGAAAPAAEKTDAKKTEAKK